jgi:hypothetical protein
MVLLQTGSRFANQRVKRSMPSGERTSRQRNALTCMNDCATYEFYEVL